MSDGNHRLSIQPLFPEPSELVFDQEEGRWVDEPMHSSAIDLGDDITDRGFRVAGASNPDDIGCGDRDGERSFKGLATTTRFNRLNDHSVCGEYADLRSSLDELFNGEGSDQDYRFT